MKRRLPVLLWRWLRIPVIVYAALALFACTMADRLIFFPPSPSYEADAKSLLTFETDAGETITALHLPAPAGRPTLLYSHGNAEDLGHSMPLYRAFHQAGFGVLAYDYPGYGHSSGTGVWPLTRERRARSRLPISDCLISLDCCLVIRLEFPVMGFPTKVQLIARKKSEQYYINFPSAVAQAMEFSKGETVEWIVHDKGHLILARQNVPANPINPQKKTRHGSANS